MPRIQVPQLSRPASVELPHYDYVRRTYHATPESYGAGSFDALAELAVKLLSKQQELVKQKDELDAVGAAARFDAAVTLTSQKLKLDHPITTTESIKVRQDAFAEAITELQARSEEGLSNNALAFFRKRVAGTLPQAYVTFHTESLQDLGKANIADLDTREDELAKVAITSSGLKHEEARGAYMALLESAAARRFIDPIEKVRRAQSFNRKVTHGQMNQMLHGGADARNQLRTLYADGQFANADPTVALKILEQANVADDKEQRANDKFTAEVKRIYLDHVASLANFGEWSEAEQVQAARGGLPGLITPDEARHYIEVNRNAPSAEGNRQAAAIWEGYATTYGGSQNENVIRKTMEELNHLRSTLTSPNPLIAKYGDKLNEDLKALRALRAAEKSSGRADLHERVRVAVQDYETRMGPVDTLDSMLFKEDQKRRAHAHNEIASRLAKGEDGVAIVEDLIKRHRGGDPANAQRKPAPAVVPPSDGQGAALELLRRRRGGTR
jgi:hypothetical protein